MGEEIEESGFPIREIIVRYGVNEDGGEVEIAVRLDGEDPENVLEIVEKLFTRLEKFGKAAKKKEEKKEVV